MSSSRLPAIRASEEQAAILNAAYAVSHNPSSQGFQELSQQTGLYAVSWLYADATDLNFGRWFLLDQQNGSADGSADGGLKPEKLAMWSI